MKPSEATEHLTPAEVAAELDQLTREARVLSAQVDESGVSQTAFFTEHDTVLNKTIDDLDQAAAAIDAADMEALLRQQIHTMELVEDLIQAEYSETEIEDALTHEPGEAS